MKIVLLILPLVLHAANNRVIELEPNEVFEVKTALGYSTLIEFDAKPTSAILGDQDAFKVEYIGNSLSVKPVLSSSKTNLFVFTDYEKFNFRLVSGPASKVDYSVRIKRKRLKKTAPLAKIPAQSLKEAMVGKTVKNSSYTLTLHSLSFPPSRTAVILKVSISAKDSSLALTNETIAVTQGNNTVPLHNFYLSSSQAKAGSPVSGTIVLRMKHLNEKTPVFLELKTKEPLKLQLPIIEQRKEGNVSNR